MALKDDVRKVQVGIVDMGKQVLPVNKVPNATPARSYPSPSATYQEDSQFINPFDRSNVTFRPMWKVEETALQQRKVITTILPNVSQATGIAISPATIGTTLAAMPDMTIPVNSNGAQVQISWNISASLSLNTALATFALFRDGIQVGQPQYGNSPTANAKFSVSQTIVDIPPSGFHVYSVYWSTSAGTLTGDNKSRSVSALVLRPQ